MKNKSEVISGPDAGKIEKSNLPAVDLPQGDRENAERIAALQRLAGIPTLLKVVSQITGMRFVVVAHVSPDSWTALSVLDQMDFGLKVGGKLHVSTTLCAEVRDSREPLIIENASKDEAYCNHPTPALYGIESYIAVPIILKSGQFFGTLCAVDSRPADLSGEHIVPTFQLFADLIGAELDRDDNIKALTTSEERYRAFIENSTEGIWRFEVDEPIPVNLPAAEQIRLVFERGYLAECNDAMAKQYGFETAESLTGVRLHDFMADDPRNAEFLTAFIESGYKLTDAESHEKDAAGNDRYFSNNFVGFIEDGKIVRAWGSQRDITNVKNSDIATARLAAIVTSSDDAIISKNLDGVITSWNKGAERMFLYKPEEAIGQTIDILIPAERQDEETEIITRIKNGEAVENFETIRLKKNGLSVDVSLTVSPIRDESGNIVGASTIARDITERLREQDILNQNQLIMTLAMQSSRMGAWERDVSAEMIWWSEELEAIFGLNKGEFRGTDEHYYSLIHADDREAAKSEVKRAIAEGRTYVIEFRFHHGDGSIRWMEGRGQAVYSQNGEPVRLYGVGIDITERKVAEITSRFLNDLNQTTQQLSDPDEIMALTARLLGQHMDVDRCAYAEVGDESVFAITGEYLRGVESIVGEWPVAAFGPECLRQMLDNEPYVVADSEHDARIGTEHLPAYRATAIAAVICVPLHKNGKFTAAMAVHQQTARSWTPAEIDLVQTVVNRCWESIERARASRTIRDSEERFRMALSSGAVTVYEQDSNLKYKWVYPEALYSPDFVGNSDIELTPGPQGELLTKLKTRVIATGKAIREEISASVQGEIFWYDLLIEPRRDADGRISGVGGTALDITDRKRAEIEMRDLMLKSERESRIFDTTLTSITDFAYTFDSEGRFIFANRPLLELLGRTRDDVIGKTFFELDYPEELATRLQNQIQLVFDSGEIVRDETPFTSPSGFKGYYEYIFNPVFADGGTVEFVVGSTRDVTDRKSSEERLRESENDLRSLADTIPQLAWMAEPDGNITWYNKGWYKFTGTVPEQMEGWGWQSVHDPEILPNVLEAWTNSIATGESFEMEFPLKGTDDKYCWFLTRVNPLYDSNGSIIRWFGTNTDINERRQSQINAEFVASLSEELARSSDTHELMQTVGVMIGEHLNIAQCAFVEISEAAGESIVTHEWHREGVKSLVGKYWLSEYLSDDFQKAGLAGEVSVVNDTRTDPRTDNSKIADFGIRSFLCVPVVKDGQWRYQINIHDSKPREWRSDEIALLRDLTERIWSNLERRRADEKIRESEERFSKAFNSSPLVVTISSLVDGRLIEVNDTFINSTGYTREEAIGKTTLDLGLWNSTDDRTAELAALSEAGEVRNLEFSFRTRDGSEIIGLLSAERIEIGGEPFALSVIQDVTDRKRVQEALFLAERRAADEYQSLLSRIVPLAQTFGAAGDLLSIYRSAKEFIRESMPCSAFFVSFYNSETGVRSAAYAWGDSGEADISKFPPMKLAEDGGINSQAVFQRRSVIINDFMTFLEGRPHMIVGDDGQNPNSSLAIPMMVMDRVIGTFEVQAYENDAFKPEHVIALEMVANLAAVAIENVRLIVVEAEARNQAESANLAKDEFLSVLSHELRTPLNAMLGWVRMLRSDVLDKESSAKALEVIERNTRLQGSLIEDLLDVSRIISGKMRIETEVVDLLTVVRTVSETVSPIAAANKVNYGFESDGAVSFFLIADPLRLQQVISNLVQNAIKFTPAGGSVNVNVLREADKAVLSVADTGIGIEPEFLPFIFDRFRQADASTKRNYTGLGLGLTIARTIVTMHGGTLDVASEGHDKGTVFTVRLPLSDEFYSQSEELAVIAANGGSAIGGLSILLVDDDPESTAPLKLFLERESARADSATNASDALRMLATGKYNVLISDIGMPGTDGFELIGKMRAAEKGEAAITAIALTAYASEDDRQRALDAGFQIHLSKPVNFDELLEILTSYANDKKQA